MNKSRLLNLSHLPLHGGDLGSAAEHFRIPLADWVDLSTGINPCAYPIAAVPNSAWQQLPYLNKAFNKAVVHYYQQASFIPVSGTQTVIQALPAILNNNEKLPVLLPTIGYKEHEQHWQKAGNECGFYPSLNAAEMVDSITQQLLKNSRQHLVIINPNNPTAVKISGTQLNAWAEQLSTGAYLIVDEAFIDVTPENSLLCAGSLPTNTIVLRSFGKFFGLAGLRVGFAFAKPEIIKQLNDHLGIWQINGPAQHMTITALTDIGWQTTARIEIQKNAVFSRHFLAEKMPIFERATPYQSAYFSSYQLPFAMAFALYQCFAEQGVLTRLVALGNEQALLRLGVFDRHNSMVLEKIGQAADVINHSDIKV